MPSVSRVVFIFTSACVFNVLHGTISRIGTYAQTREEKGKRLN
jgi:hypothetical protein